MTTVGELLAWGAEALRGVTRIPRKEAEMLLAHATGLSRLSLHAYPERLVESGAYRGMIARRAGYEPVEYIIGEVSFYGEMFVIAPGALIPRPETELLIDRFAEATAHRASPRIVEVGSGSGAVSVILARLRPDARITAVDISPDALRVTQSNIARFGVADRVTTLLSDLLAGVEGPIDALISNPPYIADAAPLGRSLDYEPPLALFGGERGDELLVRLITQAVDRAVPVIACEMGYDQRASMERLFETLGGYDVTFYRDYAGLDRGFVAQRRG